MPRSGLSRERVVEAAAAWIDRFGTAGFSMRALAESLNIRTASLYNHVESMDGLLIEVCAYALRMQRDTELRAIEGLHAAAAIEALSQAYRRFAGEHRELYRLIVRTAAGCDDSLGEVSRCIVDPFLAVLEDTPLSDIEKAHWQRVLRAMLHGFISQEDAGFFSHLPADPEESFRTAVGCCIDGLSRAIAARGGFRDNSYYPENAQTGGGN